MFKYNRIVFIYMTDKETGNVRPLHSFTTYTDNDFDKSPAAIKAAIWALENVSDEEIEQVTFTVEIVEENTEEWTGV